MTVRTFDDVDVQKLLNVHPLSPFQWMIFALCFCIVLLDGFDTAAIGYIAPSLIHEWGVTKPALAPVLSAALFGLAAGALFAGPLADGLGRRRVLTGAVVIFAASSLAAAFSPDLATLSTLRFFTGVGLGAAMPSAIALTSEYCPDRRRATLTSTMFCGFPLGAAFGGFLAAWMIPNFGWRSVLILGGAAPLLLVLLLVLLMPESVRYMVASQQPSERIRAVLVRIVGPDAQKMERFTLTETADASSAGGGFRLVLSPPYIVGSIMLWLAYFMGLVIFYAVINWMPILFKDAGLDSRTGILISALFPLGGGGAVCFGWLMDRFNANRIVAVGYALTAVTIWAIGKAIGHVGLLVASVFIAGILMNTAQASLAALAATFYPTRGRASGVALMLGIGRFGGIAGSLLVARLTVSHLNLGDIFAVVAIPGVIATAALLIKEWCSPKRTPDDGGKASVVALH
jgi:AAHS family 4-hydroxybenzoate transporter-like MFS transporter